MRRNRTTDALRGVKWCGLHAGVEGRPRRGPRRRRPGPRRRRRGPRRRRRGPRRRRRGPRRRRSRPTPMTPWPDRLIAEVANKQLTLVTHEQLVALSVGRGAISRALGRGRLHHCHQAVYSVAPPEARPPLTAELAAVLACGASAYVSHDSAAAVW